jgi:hypothetical protein
MIAAFVAGGTAAADETKMRFEPIGTYELELDGKVVPGVKMFHSPEAAAVLVMTSELPYPIAVVPRNETVQRLDPAQLQKEPLGSIAWTPKGTPTAVATFALVDKKPVFNLDGKKVRFLDKAPLLGPATIEEIFEYDPSYAYRAATAEPTTAYLDVLETWPDEVLVKIFFATQCQLCRDLLPGIFKTIELLKTPKLKFEFHGLPLPATKDPLGVELGIKEFPTGILYVKGKEVARATGPSWRMPGMAIHNALNKFQVDGEALRVKPGTEPKRP